MTKDPDIPRGNDPYGRFRPDSSQEARGQQSGHGWEPYIADQGPYTRPDATHIKGLDVGRVLSDSWDGFTQNLGGVDPVVPRLFHRGDSDIFRGLSRRSRTVSGRSTRRCRVRPLQR